MEGEQNVLERECVDERRLGGDVFIFSVRRHMRTLDGRGMGRGNKGKGKGE